MKFPNHPLIPHTSTSPHRPRPEMASVSHDIPYWLATVYVMLGDDETAFQWIEKAIQLGNENLPWFKTNPLWKRLRDDGRFLSLMKKLENERRIRQQSSTVARVLLTTHATGSAST